MLLSRKLAYGGIATALIILVISLSYLMPTADLAFFTLSSLFIAVLVIETGVRTGLMAYMASGVLITAFYGIYYSIPFIIMFGIYPIVKGFVEQRFKRSFSYIAKGVFFACISTAVVLILNDESMTAAEKWIQLIPGNGFPGIQAIWLIVLIIVIILFIYDFALSLLIEFFLNRIKRKIHQ